MIARTWSKCGSTRVSATTAALRRRVTSLEIGELVVPKNEPVLVMASLAFICLEDERRVSNVVERRMR